MPRVRLTDPATFRKYYFKMTSIDGSFTYTPNAGFTGRDFITWQVNDGAKKGDYATAFVDVQLVTISATLTVGGTSDPAPPVMQKNHY
jgi:hypothetical protein